MCDEQVGEQIIGPQFYMRKSIDEDVIIDIEKLPEKSLYKNITKKLLDEFRIEIDFFLTEKNYDEKQKNWISESMLKRYLVARNLVLKDALEMLKATLEWRDEKKVWNIRTEKSDLLSFEMETGKAYRSGFDKQKRPIIFFIDRRQNSKDYPGQIDNVIALLESAVQSMDLANGVQQWLLIFDFKKFSYSAAPPVWVAKEVLNIFMSHYPERLYKALFINSPWAFSAFYNLLSPFIPKETKEKALFVSGSMKTQREKISPFIEPETLDAAFGGDYVCHYNHKIYWQEDTDAKKIYDDHENQFFIKEEEK